MDIRPLNKQTQPARLHRRLGGLALLLVLALTFVHSTGAGAQTFTGFTVDSTDDEADREVGDGKCDTRLVTRKCTLRAAIQESNALGGRAIRVPPGTYTIELASELRFTAPSSITPTTSGRVIIQAQPGRAGSLFRVQPVNNPTSTSTTRVAFTRVDLRNSAATGAGNSSDCGGALRVQGQSSAEMVEG